MGHIHPGFILAERYPGRIEVIVLDSPRPFPILSVVFVFAFAHVRPRSFTFPPTRPSVRNGNVASLSCLFFFLAVFGLVVESRDELITFALSRRVDRVRISRACDFARRKLRVFPIYQNDRLFDELCR